MALEVNLYRFTYNHSSEPSEPIPSFSLVSVQIPNGYKIWLCRVYVEDVCHVYLVKLKQVYPIGAGVGIAPLFQYMDLYLIEPDSTTKFGLIFCSCTEKDIIFKEESEELQEKYPKRVEIFHVLKDQTDGDKSKFVKYVGSRFNTMVFVSELTECGGNDDVNAFVCGPTSFVAIVAGRMW
ncbi:unnamed protein product [Ambrosiozyma monospora]|uniref:Unnamed protein product n=1 Tax=Ambrosiozyma monospora TaxID=43982 RepID=A0A9W6YWS2_AMBMO|nr:unnamed protein product [Ambrosiozyma monospora]